MQAIIMAAGLGMRLRPLTDSAPKPMLEVAGRPILAWGIEALPREVDEVILVVSYLQEKIRAYFGNSWDGRKILYREQKELKGTGHAVHECRDLVHGRFLVVNGDDLYGADDLAVLAQHDLAVLAKPTDVSGRFGAFETDADGRLTAIVEAADVPPGALVNAGAYALDARFFEYPLVPIKDGKEFGLPQTLALVARDHAVTVLRAGFWLPIGYPDDLEKASAALIARGAVKPGV